jgi:L-lactate dehydrogenase complex protein LldE
LSSSPIPHTSDLTEKNRSRPRVVLFPTCLAALLYPGAARATERVLDRAGCDVDVRPGAVCCGQPAWNSGHVEQARRVAMGTLAALSSGTEPIVLCSGSCTTMLVHYWPELFEGTGHEEDAEHVAGRARELCSFLADDLGVESLGRMSLAETAVSYHDSCHMLRGLGIRAAPRALLSAIEGVEVRELDSCERCCGFGGTFSLRFPELSAAMADEKVDDAVSTGADVLVASDLGCLMQIAGRAEARGVAVAGRYIAEVVDEAMDRAR